MEYKTEDRIDINSLLSLIFQWENRQAFIILK